MAAAETGHPGAAAVTDPLLALVAALPPALATRIAATAEALHLLAPYCQPQAPADVLAVAQAHRRVSLLGKVQRQVAQAAPYAVQLDLLLARKLRWLVPCFEWLLAHSGRVSVSLNVSTQQGCEVRAKGCTLNLQEAQLLGRVLAAHDPDTSSKPITAVSIRASELGQRFDAGILAPYRHLAQVQLLWFASADLAGLPHSVRSVDLVLPGRSFIVQHSVDQLVAGAGEAVRQTQAAVAAAAGPAAGAAAAMLVAAKAAAIATADFWELVPMQPPLRAALKVAAAASWAARATAASWASKAALRRPWQALTFAAGVAARLGGAHATKTTCVAVGAAMMVQHVVSKQSARWANQLPAIAACVLKAAAPALVAAAQEAAADAAAAPQAAIAAADAAWQAWLVIWLQQLELLRGQVAVQGTLHPIEEWPAFRLDHLGIDGGGLDVVFPAQQLFASAREVAVSARLLRLQLPAEVAQQAQQGQQAGGQLRRPWWRFWRAAAEGARQLEAVRRLHAVLQAFAHAPLTSQVTLFAPQWELGPVGFPGAGAVQQQQQQQVVLTGQQVGQLLRHDVARPQGVRAAAGLDGSLDDRVTLCHRQPHQLLAIDGEALLTVGMQAVGTFFLVQEACKQVSKVRKEEHEKEQLQQQLALGTAAKLGL